MRAVSRAPHERPVLVLKRPDDLETIRRLPLFARPWRAISLQFHESDVAAMNGRERELNAAYKECGCRLGALSTVAALAVAIWERTVGWTPGFSAPARWGSEVAFVIASAALGKFLGVVLARRALARRVAELTSIVRSAAR